MRFSEFLTEKVSSNVKVALDFRLSIPIASELHVGLSSEKSFKESAELAAQSLSSVIDKPVKVRTKIGGRSKSWMIEPSTSSDRSGSHTIEIMSPILHVSEAITTFSKVSQWMDDNSLRTTDSDYLRAALHIESLNSRLDPVKMVLYLDGVDPNMVFGKVGKVAQPWLDTLIYKMKKTGKLPLQAAALHKAAIDYLSKTFIGANFGNVQDDILEIKIASGAGYQHNVDGIKSKLLRFTKAMDIASNPGYMKSEYINKILDLYKNASVTSNRVQAEIKVPPELESLFSVDPELKHSWRVFAADHEYGDARDALLVLVKRVEDAARMRKQSLTASEKAFLKMLIRETGLTADNVDMFYKSDAQGRLKFKRDFML